MGILDEDRGPFAQALAASAKRLGTTPRDLATVISFETGGTFSPSVMGGKGGKYLGLIQFGPNEQKQYGANAKQTREEQLGAVERYLTGRGFKPGMDIRDLYSTILAGRPGKYTASDKAAGGAVGSVTEAVGRQMDPHRAKADRLLAGVEPGPPPTRTAAAPTADSPRYPNSPLPTGPTPEQLRTMSGILADTPDPFKQLAETRAAQEKEQQAQQLAQAMAASTKPEPQPQPTPAAPPEQPVNYAALLMPHLRRGLLGGGYGGLLA